MTLIGAKRHVNRVAALLGPVERASNATDLIWVCLAIAIGGLIGLPALNLARLSIGLAFLSAFYSLHLWSVGCIRSSLPSAEYPSP